MIYIATITQNWISDLPSSFVTPLQRLVIGNKVAPECIFENLKPESEHHLKTET